jgi:hypothetical protein
MRDICERLDPGRRPRCLAQETEGTQEIGLTERTLEYWSGFGMTLSIKTTAR